MKNLFNLFNRNKVNINSLAFPEMGWECYESDQQVKKWISPDQTMEMILHFFPKPPDIPTITDITILRKHYRTLLSKGNGGIIEIEIIEIKGIPICKTLFKFPMDPNGMAYLASLTIPFKDFSFVVKVQAPEVGMTGMRDTMIANKLIREEVISMGENGYEGWFKDPYDPDLKEGLLMNLSEDAKYDSRFPKHPLSKVRALIKEIELGLSFGEEVEKANRF